MFAIYIWLIAGFWLRLNTTINVFGVGSSQPLLLKKIVISYKSHIFEILVWVNDCNHGQCFNVQSSSGEEHSCLVLHMG